MPDLRKALASRQLLLMDGAMGTELKRSAGLSSESCYEAWNLINAEHVRGIHQSYIAAGAECLLTNTFQSNPQSLASHGQHGNLEAINRQALELARLAAGSQRFVDTVAFAVTRACCARSSTFCNNRAG